jgi:hypothetical protein
LELSFSPCHIVDAGHFQLKRVTFDDRQLTAGCYCRGRLMAVLCDTGIPDMFFFDSNLCSENEFGFAIRFRRAVASEFGGKLFAHTKHEFRPRNSLL